MTPLQRKIYADLNMDATSLRVATMSMSEALDRALVHARACRDDRKRAEHILEIRRRQENEAIVHLQELVQAQRKSAAESASQPYVHVGLGPRRAPSQPCP
jgi:hypothetical protein